MFILKPAEHKTLCDVVVESIEDAILDGKLSPGTRLIESDVAQQLGVSKATVREALLTLERLGLVRSQPRRGTFVTKMSPEHVSEVFSARALLEGYAARLAARAGGDADFDRLATHIDFSTANRVSESRARVECDLGFHDLLMELGGNNQLQDMWTPLRSQVKMLLILIAVLPPTTPIWEWDEASDSHLGIVTALRARDPDGAQRAVLEHIAQGEHRLLSRLASEDVLTPFVTAADFPALVGSAWAEVTPLSVG